MRFILKCAFWLGLVAFLLPFGERRDETTAEISWFGAFAGAQEALQDLGGFCERAPRACAAGRDIALFASERVADGLAIAYDFVDTRRTTATDLADTSPAHRSGQEAAPDSLVTGGVPAEAAMPLLPRAYTAPKRTASPPAHAPASSPATAVPTPAPRV